jgi:hypothetical protein
MKAILIAGVFSALTCGAAAAAEPDPECQIDETRRQARGERVATNPPPPRAVTRPNDAARTFADADTQPVTPRRRSGKTIPDAELIGRRGAL